MGVISDGASDEECWRAAIDGDSPAFALVFDRHADSVYTHCLRRTHSVPDAEDLTSVTFLEAWRARDHVRFVDGSARPWLLVVATNVSRNHARSTRRYRAHLARLPHELPSPDAAGEALSNIAREETVRAVADAVASLKRTEYEVVSLCDLAGLSYTDAAQALDIPLGTVRSRLSRARARLRTLLAPLDPYTSGPGATGTDLTRSPAATRTGDTNG